MKLLTKIFHEVRNYHRRSMQRVKLPPLTIAMLMLEQKHELR